MSKNKNPDKFCTVLLNVKNDLIDLYPQLSDSDYDMLECFSDDEGATSRIDELIEKKPDAASPVNQKLTEDDADSKSDTSTELKKLLRRREELERSNKLQEKRHERYQVSKVVVG